MSKSEKVYRSLTGHNYPSTKSGKEVRVEPGGKVEYMPASSAKHELAAGNIEEWEAGKTENVRSEDDTEATVTGVESRHQGGEIKLKEVGE